MSDNIIGFSIEIKGTDTQVGKLGDMKRELIGLTDQFNKLKNSTAGNAGAQKAAATQMGVLSTQIKALNSNINAQQKLIIDTAKANEFAEGSYNQLSAQLSVVSQQWKNLGADERDNQQIGKDLTAQRESLNSQLKKLDETVGIHSRNVGNYTHSILGNAKAIGGLAGIMDIFGKVLGVNEETLQTLKETHAAFIMGARDVHHITEVNTEATIENTVATEGAVVATEEQTLAQKILNAVMNANPVIWVIAGITALIGVFAYLYSSTKDNEEAIKDFNKALDEQQKEIETQVSELKKLGIEYDVLTGKITQAEGDILKAKLESSEKQRDINKKYLEDRKKIIEDYSKEEDGFFTTRIRIQELEEQKNKKLLVLQKNFTTELLNEQTEAASKSLNIKFQAQNEEDKKLSEERKKALEKEISERKKALDELKALDDKYIQDSLKASAHTDQEKLDQERLAAMDELQVKVDAAKKAGVSEIEITRLNNRGILAIDKEFDEKQKDLDAKNAKTKSDLLDKQNKDSIELNKKSAEQKAKDQKDINDMIERNEKAHAALMNQIQKELTDAGFNIAKEADNAYFTSQADKNSRDLQQLTDHLTLVHETEANSLQARLTSGAITQAEFDKEKKISDDKFSAEELKAKKDAFEQDKKLKKEQIEIELAIAIVRAVAANANKGLAGIATGAIQIAEMTAIAGIQLNAINQQKFERGGVLDGQSHAEGGIPFTVNGQSGFEAEDGEALINKRSTMMFRPLLSAINAAGGGKKFASGGVPSPSISGSSAFGQSFFDSASFARTIIDGINDKKVIQVESDVRGIINKVQQIESQSTF